MARQGLNRSLEGWPVRAPYPLNQLISDLHSLGRTVLKEQEGRHRRDAIPRGNIIDVVHVHFGERKLAVCRVLVGQFRKDGRNGATRRTPVGVEVYYHVSGRGQKGIELGGIRYFVNLARSFGDGQAVRK